MWFHPASKNRSEWLRGLDSNQDNQLQRLACYRLHYPGIVREMRGLLGAVRLKRNKYSRQVGVRKSRGPVKQSASHPAAGITCLASRVLGNPHRLEMRQRARCIGLLSRLIRPLLSAGSRRGIAAFCVARRHREGMGMRFRGTALLVSAILLHAGTAKAQVAGGGFTMSLDAGSSLITGHPYSAVSETKVTGPREKGRTGKSAETRSYRNSGGQLRYEMFALGADLSKNA